MAQQCKTIATLLEQVAYTSTAPDDLQVSGIAYASNKVVPGDVFFCVVGFKADGHAYAPDAVSRGAVALVVERELDLDVPQYVVGDSREALALAAAAFYGYPTRSLSVIGITGTNGKTTTAFLVEWICRQAGRTTGLIGTVETRVAGEVRHSSHTTPESLDLQGLFADMLDAGVDTCVMEVSSQGLDLDRVDGSAFAVAAFSNLTQDHLDYHHTIEEYFACKQRLFTDYPVGSCAVCIDDEYGRRIADAARGAGHSVMTCGFSEDADLRPLSYECTPHGIGMVLGAREGTVELRSQLVGRFNVENILLACAIARSLGIGWDVIADAIARSPQVPGRLESVPAAKPHGFSVLVDYAHTPDAIEKALGAVREICSGEVWIVFGCGGDRDNAKRPLMGAAACAADHLVVTSDNPRTEDPDSIIAEILPGIAADEDRVTVLVDRREGIRHAVSHAQPGDCVLIAGKGHEDYQLIAGQVLQFDDRVVAAEEIDAL